MPIHDWTRVDAGLFHAFHHRWIDALCDALNTGVLPPDYFALPEQRVQGPIPDVLTLRLPTGKSKPESAAGGTTVAVAAPPVRLVSKKENAIYSRRASRVTVRHRHGEVVAIIEIVSPGNKATAAECRTFVRNAADLIAQGVNLLVIDLFPPGKHDPHRLHEAIWDEFEGEEDDIDPPADLPADKPLTLAAYDAGPVKVAYVEPVAVGDPLPDMPVFLQPEVYVPVPLGPTYETTWNLFPAPPERAPGRHRRVTITPGPVQSLHDRSAHSAGRLRRRRRALARPLP